MKPIEQPESTRNLTLTLCILTVTYLKFDWYLEDKECTTIG